MTSRLGNVVTDFIELQLRSASALLDLSKGYVKALDGIIRTSGKKGQEASASAAAHPRVPLLLAGEAGETVRGAFIINNPSTNDLSLALVVQGELSHDDVNVAPASLTLSAGEEAVIRVVAKLTAKLEENRDYRGVVAIPGISNQVLDFVVRRLPHRQPDRHAFGGNASD